MQIFRKTKTESPLPQSRRPGGRQGERGFTLIELLAVIGVIAVISVMAVGGYTGILRALSETSAGDTLSRAVQLARQQACVDGTDLWVWPTDVNKFIIVRKVGTVLETDTGSRTPSYYTQPVNNVLWILDPYADMEDSGAAMTTDSGLSAAEKKVIADEFVKGFSGMYLFDLDGEVLSNYVWPPWYSSEDCAWVFGIPKDPPFGSGSGYFDAGHEYGVVVQAEQSLPKGYYFDGLDDSNGDFDPKKARASAVHVLADGRVDEQRTFRIADGTDNSNMTTVKVNQDGSVEIK